MRGTTTRKDGVTTHRCRTCGRRFEGTGRKGRPYSRCPECRTRAEVEEREAGEPAGRGEL